MIYAHSVLGVTDTQHWEPLFDHLKAVAITTRENARCFGAGSVAETVGWLHDLGKVKLGFQDKLRGHPNDIPHSGEGAVYAEDNLGGIGKLMSFCIAGHHSGLPNGLNRSHGRPSRSLRERLLQSETVPLPDGVSLPKLEVPSCLDGLSPKSRFEMQFFTRMLFSALVDADFIETERFYSPSVTRKSAADL
ncbi:CRISPR-associated endonuclease Cas3-HD [Thalassovita gelatinovora]|uniref:CRISPR-associated endonuclease Cas3-HD n=1 Tax=Thalassovita gelatinovora TaxID=53501 RepID=A0A0P1FHJ6_THAGE|nr:CRISPR-associated endonuclease Cas3'' [Thalassovita gelatinovora]QIZ81968.1 CRISPR-associated endonuclease Cas3'' [Thalassovita gelatinovora]CUH67383.1 CRISPR-associated endonuclease Cas3-HD [Thalassovita gelatinovora]SEP75145.1 CRISPR-associated endonuclease Cas3-HD [Thalassovita gelatinovora]